jgi:hypothetical protein
VEIIRKPKIKGKLVPKESQWISGVGAGSWFAIHKQEELYKIERFSIKGELECSGLFIVKPEGFNIENDFSFTYLSHCKSCTIIQEKKIYKFYKNNL